MSRALAAYYLKAFLLFLLYLTLSRAVFISYHFNAVDDSSSSGEVFPGFFYGLMVDSSVLSIGLLICFMLASLFFFLKPTQRSRVHQVFCSIFFFILVTQSLADIIYFENYGTRLTALALNLVHDPGTVGMTISHTIPITYSVVFLTGSFGFFFAFIRWGKTPDLKNSGIRWLIVFLLCVAAFSFLYAGPPFWRITSYSSSSTLNQAALNGLYTIVKSIQQTGLTDHDIPSHDYKHPMKEMRDLIVKQNEKLLPGRFLARLRTDTLPDKKKNVVIILMESFGSNLCGVMNGGKGFTPRFDEWSRKGILLTDFYSNGPRTIQGLVSTTASFPAILGIHPVRRKGITEFQTIGNVYLRKNYNTKFIHGGDAGFDDMDVYLKSGGFPSITDIKDYANPEFPCQLGVSDEDLFNKAFDLIWSGDNSSPTLSVILTLSNHIPFDIPSEFLETHGDLKKAGNMEKGIYYSDYALGQFLDKCAAHPEFDNTIFVILGDHAEMSEPADSDFRIFHVPCLILNSGKTPGIISETCSQTDIAPTLNGLLHLTVEHHFIGQDILASDFAPFAFCKGYGNDVFMKKDSIIAKYYFEDAQLEFYKDSPKKHFSQKAVITKAEEENYRKFIESYLQMTSHIFRKGLHRVK